MIADLNRIDHINAHLHHKAGYIEVLDRTMDIWEVVETLTEDENGEDNCDKFFMLQALGKIVCGVGLITHIDEDVYVECVDAQHYYVIKSLS